MDGTATATVVILGIIILLVYFLPSIVAVQRRHHNSNAILILNLFLGWTFLGWVAALVWACTQVKKQPQ